MIHFVSEKVSEWLEKEGLISCEYHALFAYAVYSLLFGMLPVLIISILGIVFGMLQEGLLMILPFMAIRKFSGGFHMKSARHCIFFSITILSTGLGMIRAMSYTNQPAILTLLVVISVISICFFSPLDNTARKLSPKEKKTFKKIACIISVTALLAYLMLQSAALVSLAAPIGIGVLITALLQLPCIVSNIRLVHSPNNQICTEYVISSNSD